MKTKSKDMNQMLKQLSKLGWHIENCGSGHIRVINKVNEHVTISRSCSDKRGILNARSDLRKIGAPF